MEVIVKNLVVLLLFLIFPISFSCELEGSAESKNFSNTALSIAKDYGLPLIKTLGLGYLGCWGYLLSHEFGHAITAKALYGCPIDIHLGIGIGEDPSHYLFKIGGITVHSLNPLKGYASFIGGDMTKVTRTKEFAIYAAGGVMGGLQSILVLVGLAAYTHFKNTGDLGVSLGAGFKNAFSPFQNMKQIKGMSNFEANLYSGLVATMLALNVNVARSAFIPGSLPGPNFLPSVCSYTDGTRAWKIAGANEKTCKAASVISWLIEWALRVAIIVRARSAVTEYTKQSA